MSTAERKSLEFLETSYIQNVKDVYLAVEYSFGRSTKKLHSWQGKVQFIIVSFFFAK